MGTTDLFKVIEGFVDRAGLMLVDLTVRNTGRSCMIRLLVDKPERVTIRDCAELTRSIKDHLDGNMLQLDYRLEVSSPGIGRLLCTEVDWERSIGRKLSVHMEDEDFSDWLEEYREGFLKFREGRIVIADDIVRAVEILD
jgi:ribosome maturation factor RimP